MNIRALSSRRMFVHSRTSWVVPMDSNQTSTSSVTSSPLPAPCSRVHGHRCSSVSALCERRPTITNRYSVLPFVIAPTQFTLCGRQPVSSVGSRFHSMPREKARGRIKPALPSTSLKDLVPQHVNETAQSQAVTTATHPASGSYHSCPRNREKAGDATMCGPHARASRSSSPSGSSGT